MASYQRVALFVFFDALERDLVRRIKSLPLTSETILSEDERAKSQSRKQKRDPSSKQNTDIDLLYDLDLGDKYSILLRNKSVLDQASVIYFESLRPSFQRAIPVRNAIMHGRPLTTEDYATGFALINDTLKAPGNWPELSSAFGKFEDDPSSFLATSLSIIEQDTASVALNNLPTPDYDDTGFLPRPELERDLRRKILGRHPVITIIGEGGNGKTALALQTLYGLLHSNEHDFDAIIWISAKSTKLTSTEVERIEGAINDSLGVFAEVAENFEPGIEDPVTRVRRLLETNQVLLVIDNLETVLDNSIRDFATDVPGKSKLLFTSRIPLGSDLLVQVGELSIDEARSFMRRLIVAYDIRQLRGASTSTLSRYITRLGRKPLLLKWFCLGVSNGLDPERIVADPSIALRFCMENVFENLSSATQNVLLVISTIPSALSLAAMQYITGIAAAELEKAVAQLLQFGLIERVDQDRYEVLYQIKSFTKAYLTRVLRSTPEGAASILARFKYIEGTYQKERGKEFGNPYDHKTYTVRSRSEALAAGRLRHASSLAFRSKFEDAEQIITEIKISNPEYFEVFRAEAFIAYKAGDINRADSSYQIAIDLAPDQPQLNFFYAGFLMRSLADLKAASVQLNLALTLDPENAILLREAARNAMFQFDFKASQELCDRVWAVKRNNVRDEILITDLQAQIFVRKSDVLLSSNRPRDAIEELGRLVNFINSIEDSIFDETLIEHIARSRSLSNALRRGGLSQEDENILKGLDKLLERISKMPTVHLIDADRPVEPLVKTGVLKEEGRKEAYGFIKDAWGSETFIHKDTVDPVVWNDMREGRPVSFDIVHDAQGRPRATNVRLL